MLSIFVILPSFASANLPSSSRENVAFAGFALVGSNKLLLDKFPYSSLLQKEIKSKLILQTKQLEPTNYNLVTNKLVDADKGSSITIALALEEEKVLIEKVDELYKLSISLTTQVIVFDFDESEGAIIATYPVQLPTYIDVFNDRPNKRVIKVSISKLYFGGLTYYDREEKKEKRFGNVIDEFIGVIKNIQIKSKYVQELGIGNIDFREHALGELVAPTYKENPKILSEVLARYLGGGLFREEQISVIPQNFDNSVGQMALRFTGEKSAHFFSLPKPDYLIDISVRLLTSDNVKQTDTYSETLYQSIVRFTVRYGYDDSLEPIFSKNLRGNNLIRTPSGVEIDEWRASEVSMKSVIDEFVSNISKPTREWVRRQELSKAELNQLKIVKKVIEKCR